MISVILFLICVLLVSFLIYEEIGRLYLKNENESLQRENSDLIERNQKLDQYLDEARAEAVRANHKLMKVIERTEIVYLAVDSNDKIRFAYRTQEEIKTLLDERKDLKPKILYLSNK